MTFYTVFFFFSPENIQILSETVFPHVPEDKLLYHKLLYSTPKDNWFVKIP